MEHTFVTSYTNTFSHTSYFSSFWLFRQVELPLTALKTNYKILMHKHPHFSFLLGLPLATSQGQLITFLPLFGCNHFPLTTGLVAINFTCCERDRDRHKARNGWERVKEMDKCVVIEVWGVRWCNWMGGGGMIWERNQQSGNWRGKKKCTMSWGKERKKKMENGEFEGTYGAFKNKW